MMRFGARLLACLILALSAFIGTASLLAFASYLVAGPFNFVDLELETPALLAWDALLCLAFFAQHSGMIRRSYRRRLSALIPPPYHGALYSIASGTVLLLLLVLWQECTHTLFDPPATIRWLGRVGAVVAIVGMTWSLGALRSFDSFGIAVLLAHLRGTWSAPTSLVIRGPYRWVRHPLYSCMLLLIWSRADVTADRLLLNVSWTIWIVLGTMLEERDLVTDFGDAYRDYQREVPMLIPRRLSPAKGRPHDAP